MSTLTETKGLGDWLLEEFGAPNYCRSELTVLVPADLPSGQVFGVESTFSKYAKYDNSNPAAAAAVLVNALEVKDEIVISSIVDAANVATITTATPHGCIVGDIVKVSGVTTDTDLNANATVVSVPTSTTMTIASASVTDATYSDTTMKLTKLNQQAACLVRGPAVIIKPGLNWGVSDAPGITAGLADLLALGIVAREGV